MRALAATLIFISCLMVHPAIASETATATTAEGALVKVLIDLPASNGAYPVVVYANGQEGHMLGDLPSAVARRLTAGGTAVVRLDWRFRTAGLQNGRFSGTLREEIADLDAVLAFVGNDPRLKDRPVVLVGKSLGSMIAVRALATHPDVKGAVLLTPICSLTAKPGDADWKSEPYPGLVDEARPITFVVGDADPICRLPALYALALKMKRPPRIAVVDGDHGFFDPSWPALKTEYVEWAATTASAAVATIFREVKASRK